ncbi:MAG TPA: hypothetical protein VFS08_16470 [Gemmatimonadaceae bacterium]|nr:hypothetical protein [Gemmatimonadaceae bacterium]
MATLFLVCAVLGGSALLLQLAASLLGLEHGDVHLEHAAGAGLAGGLNLLSVRSLVAAVAFFGIGGRAALAAGLGTTPALLVALASGGVAAVAVAAAMRLLRNFDRDGVVRIERAIGQPARVHVRLPADRSRPGKVLLTLQDRLVEVPAVSLDGELPTGTEVTVVGLAAPDTLEVVRTPEPGD